MDKSLWVSMTGASRSMQDLGVVSHNLSNASTVGFRAALTSAQAQAIDGQGLPTRVTTAAGPTGVDTRSGALMTTGRDLDVALADDHWLAVQAEDGSTAYTRAGDLQLSSLGQLTTASGQPVMGDGGPIAVPPHDKLSIGSDGTVSVVPAGGNAAVQISVGRLQVAEIPADAVVRRDDGLFGSNGEFEPEAASGNVLRSGVLEGSNVNAAETLVSMIELQRRFELQVKAMKTAEENGEAGDRILRTSS